jgi:hypothetical protein
LRFSSKAWIGKALSHRNFTALFEKCIPRKVNLHGTKWHHPPQQVASWTSYVAVIKERRADR